MNVEPLDENLIAEHWVVLALIFYNITLRKN